jgi:hypothetical protein
MELIPSFVVGKRNAANAYWLMKDLESRLASRVQLTTDGFRPYVDAVDSRFGTNVDFAMLVKIYSGDEPNRERYRPSEIVEARPIPIMGFPKFQRISTSHVETSESDSAHAGAPLHSANERFFQEARQYESGLCPTYNFCRIHQTLRITPAMAAGISDHVWSIQEIIY